ncbi:hypothetical protein FRB95_000079 [Tulasnella sp. JGI-2019a]|nr:hypothetical protein FRB93_009484 [Tulasnella sp. JGI-2019a]KAG9040150.1 hypothetical protein FRB95_000079 [Tulasnella sp. JGI-2019a]
MTADLAEGLLYVAICHKSPPLISQEILNKWYDEVHIPSLCETPNGTTIGLRYENASPRANTKTGEGSTDVPYPILAMYKLHDMQWLSADDGFLSVPITADVFPAEVGHNAFACFDVQVRSYEVVARSLVRPGTDRPRYLVTFETPAETTVDYDEVIKVYATMPGYRGSIFYGIVEGLLKYEQKDLANRGLALIWFDERPVMEGGKDVAQVWQMKHQTSKEDAEF